MGNSIVINTNEPYHIPFLWDGKTSEIVYHVDIVVPDASLVLTGLLLGKAKSTLHLVVNVTHAAPRTMSRILINGVMKDTASVNFDGLVTINNGAKQSKARLDSHILLLSDSARGRVVPSLQILENDVNAGHAATVGKIDAMQLFYLQSRGLSETLAKRLLVEGFLRSTINQLPIALKKKAEKGIVSYVS